jgi:hypothetical protein
MSEMFGIVAVGIDNYDASRDAIRRALLVLSSSRAAA